MLQVEQDLLEKLLRDVLALGDVANENRQALGLLGESNQGSKRVLCLLGNHAGTLSLHRDRRPGSRDDSP